MNKIILLILFFSILPSFAKPRGLPPQKKAEIEALLTNYNACIMVFDSKSKRELFTHNKDHCKERLTACSTFKVALAAIAFDSGVIKDENEKFIWDKTPRSIEAWNKDHSALSWMKDSVVWVSQLLTPKIGVEKLTTYLKKFNYGTADLSGGLTTAWLTTAPFLPNAPKSTLRISAKEQVQFLDRLYSGKLPISKTATELTKKLTYLEETPAGFSFYGKTGSGLVGENQDQRLGWFVSYLEQANDPREKYVAVINITDLKKMSDVPPYSGKEAKDILIKVLKILGKW